MTSSITPFPKNWQDAPLFYLDQGLALFPVPLRGKSMFRGSRGHLDASTDPKQIRDWQNGFKQFCWACATGKPSRRSVLDIEQREIRGQDGTLSLRQYAEAQGITESLIAYGRTPIDLTPNAGLHIHLAATDVATPSGIILPFVELKADGTSIRLPPAPGRSWDENCPPGLEPLPMPEWLLALLHLRKGKDAPKALPPEGPLDGQPFTPIGRRVTEALINRALDRATSTRQVLGEARRLATLVLDNRISDAFARRAIERLSEEIGTFSESGFSRDGLRSRMMTSFERRCRRG